MIPKPEHAPLPPSASDRGLHLPPNSPSPIRAPSVKCCRFSNQPAVGGGGGGRGHGGMGPTWREAGWGPRLRPSQGTHTAAPSNGLRPPHSQPCSQVLESSRACLPQDDLRKGVMGGRGGPQACSPGMPHQVQGEMLTNPSGLPFSLLPEHCVPPNIQRLFPLKSCTSGHPGYTPKNTRHRDQ